MFPGIYGGDCFACFGTEAAILFILYTKLSQLWNTILYAQFGAFQERKFFNALAINPKVNVSRDIRDTLMLLGRSAYVRMGRLPGAFENIPKL
jgi:hypothetical protein